MVALLMIGLLGIAIYSAWDPQRNTEAGEEFNNKVAERGAVLFARNCRLCHGDVGEGGALGGRLAAAPALNRPDLQGFVDSKATLAENINARAETFGVSDGSKFKSGSTILIDEEWIDVKKVDGNNLTVVRGVDHSTADAHSAETDILLLDPAALTDKVKLVTNTIICGRVGTGMQPWSQAQGGPLSDEQIRQLTVLITENRWALVAHEVDIEDATRSRLQREVDPDTTLLPVTDVSFFAAGDAIRIGEERIIINALPRIDPNAKDKSGALQVQRGALGSIPLPHTPDEEIFKFPQTAEPSINQASCGQTARPAAPSAPPSEKECAEPCQTVNLTAQGVQFNTKEISVKSGGNVRIHFTNNDAGVQHNVAVYNSSTNLTPVAPTSVGTIFQGPGVDDVVFPVPPVASYYFRCDVHPTTMTGDFVVTQ